MPYEILLSGQLITTRLYGLVTPKELLDSAVEMAKIEAEQPVTLNRLTDLLGVEASDFDTEAIHQLAAVRSEAVLRNPVKSAIVAPKPAHYGFSRMFQTLNENPLITVEVFHDLRSALAWLESDS